MKLLDESVNSRILVVDDSEAIHEDFRKILQSQNATNRALGEMAASLFGDSNQSEPALDFELHHALQGQVALELAKEAVAAGQPYAVCFMDVRMPPGWDGIQTIERIWEIDSEIETVICTAYSDFSWTEIVRRLNHPERLLILRKPFDNIEVRQLACGLRAKWALRRQASCRLQDLEIMVEERTRQLLEAQARLASVGHVEGDNAGQVGRA